MDDDRELFHAMTVEPNEVELISVLGKLFVESHINLYELQAYYLFLEEYFSTQRQHTDKFFGNKTEIVRLMCERSKTISDEWYTRALKYRQIYQKRKTTPPKMKSVRFLNADATLMYALFCGLEEAKLIMYRERDVEFTLYPELFAKANPTKNKKQTKKKLFPDRRKKENKLSTFQPRPSEQQIENNPVLNKYGLYAEKPFDVNPRHTLELLRVFFKPSYS